MKKSILSLIVLLCANLLLSQGYLGIYVATPSSAELRSAGLSYGLKIESVIPGSPAELGGLRQNHIIHKINNTKIRTENDLSRLMSNSQPNQTITVHYVENRRNLTKQVTLIDRDDLHKELYIYNYIQNPWLFIGITVEAVSPALAEVLKLETGMVIHSVRDKSIATVQGLEAGDIIISINGHITNNERALTEALNKGLQNQPMSFSLWRSNQIISKSIDLSNSLNADNPNSNEIFIIAPDVFDNELYRYTREQVNAILNKPKSEFEADIERLEDEIFQLRQRMMNGE